MNELYSQRRIREAVYRLAADVRNDAKKTLHVHVIMDGAFMFAADFLRAYEGKISRTTFTQISRGYSSGRVHPPRFVHKFPNYFAKYNIDPGYTHLILDVCIEKGLTMSFMKRHLAQALSRYYGGNSTQVLSGVLVALGHVCPTNEIVDYVCFECTKQVFLTGYGMGPYRDFGAIYGIPR